MKHIFKSALFAASLFTASTSFAQTHKDSTLGHKISKTAKKGWHETSDAATTVGHKTATVAKKGWHATSDAATTVGHKTEKTADKVGNKTAEVASKGAAAVADKEYESKVAPNGEKIYIDKNSAYYYVNSKGHHVYVKKSALVDKPM